MEIITAEQQVSICQGCDYQVNNPDGGWCYMMDRMLIGCKQYENCEPDY